MAAFLESARITALAVLVGMLLVVVGSVPKDILFAVNLRLFPAAPWLIASTCVYLWLYWRYVGGAWWPGSTAAARRSALRANPLPLGVWFWALLSGLTAIAALVLTLRVLNRMVSMPTQDFFPVSQASAATVIAIIVVGAIAAAVVEESAFRGYMQGPIERRLGIIPAVLITGVMFGVAHLGVTAILMPYYIVVSALYGITTYLTNSILPAVVLHTGGNIFSSTYLWLTGHAEWQQSARPEPLIWRTGADPAFWLSVGAALIGLALTLWAYRTLARSADAARRRVVTAS